MQADDLITCRSYKWTESREECFLSVLSSEFSVNIYNVIYKNKQLSAEDTRVKYNIDYLTIFTKGYLKFQELCTVPSGLCFFCFLLRSPKEAAKFDLDRRVYTSKIVFGQKAPIVSSQNCTTPTCIIMQKCIINVYTCRVIFSSPTHRNNLCESLHQ